MVVVETFKQIPCKPPVQASVLRRWPARCQVVLSFCSSGSQNAVARRHVCGALFHVFPRGREGINACLVDGWCNVSAEVFMAGRVGISDVAAAAGVSIATVSVALNDVEGARV